MKQDSLFKGAIVLARPHYVQKRSRCEVIKPWRDASTVRDGLGRIFVANNEDIRPAKITRNSLKEIGFVERESICPRRLKPSCHEFVYPLEYPWSRETRIILKDECDQWGPTRMFGGLGVHKVKYIHEVQKILNSKQEQK